MRCNTSPRSIAPARRSPNSTSDVFRSFIIRFDSVYAVDPALAQIPAQVRQAAIALLNRVTNGVDRLLSLEPTPKGWKARFLENGKPVLAEWDGRELVTTLLSDLPLKGYQRTDAARKNCVKGRWCVGKTGRGSCISVKKKCRQELQMREMEAADRITEMLRQQTGGHQPTASGRGSRRRRATPEPYKTTVEKLKEAGIPIGSHINPKEARFNNYFIEANLKTVVDLFRAAKEMGGDWHQVYLKDLRKRFPQLSRLEFDEIVKYLDRMGAIVMMPTDDPLSITKKIEEGAIDVGGVKLYSLRIRGL